MKQRVLEDIIHGNLSLAKSEPFNPYNAEIFGD